MFNLDQINKDIQHLLIEYKEDNWDGEGSSKINLQSLKYTRQLLQYLSTSSVSALPELCISRNGGVCLDWWLEHRTVTLEVEEDGKIIWAVLYHPEIRSLFGTIRGQNVDFYITVDIGKFIVYLLESE